MIDPNETYRIHGNRGTVPYVAVLANRVGASGTDRVADNIVIDDKGVTRTATSRSSSHKSWRGAAAFGWMSAAST
ncbi:hypothetical protein ACETU7_21355 [Rhodococcus sp. 3Y1]